MCTHSGSTPATVLSRPVVSAISAAAPSRPQAYPHPAPVRAEVDRQRATTRRNGHGPAVRDTDGRTAGGDQASAAARRVAACSLSQLFSVATRSSR
jgi:hypothetical protein